MARRNPELLAELTERCAEVTKVPVYQWALPEDLRPLREAVHSVVNGSVDVVLFMTAVQVIHLFQVSEEMGLRDELSAGLRALVVVSIGPTTSEELAHYGITPDFEPSRPKMGFIVNEAAQYAGKILAQKKNRLASLTVSTDPGTTSPVEKEENKRASRACTGLRHPRQPWQVFATA